MIIVMHAIPWRFLDDPTYLEVRRYIYGSYSLFDQGHDFDVLYPCYRILEYVVL